MPANPMDYSSGRDTVLDVARTERAKFYNIIDDPNNWYVQTRCSEWEVRDMVGHMIDVTEGYLTAWDMARKAGVRYFRCHHSRRVDGRNRPSSLHGTYTNVLLSLFPNYRLWYSHLGHEVGPWR